MLEIILNWAKDIPKELVLIIIAAVPVLELRWSMFQGFVFWKMPLFKVLWLSILGNLIPVAPVLFLLEPVSNKLRRFRIWARFFDWLFERTKKKADLVQKYEALGLALFVAIPLPGTGAWTGCFAATLFKIRFRYAFIAISAGVIGAGLIVATMLALGVIGKEVLVR